MRAGLIALLAGGAVLPVAALAQAAGGASPRAGIEQLSGGRDRGVDAAQAVPDARQAVHGVADVVGRAAGAVPSASQVAAPEAAARPVVQLSDGKRDARGAVPLSRRSEGRRGDAAAVGGRDRCDPGAGARATADPACARVIERRADDYARPPARLLSPEEALLADRRIAEPRRAERLVRDIGRGAAAGDEEVQQVAAIVLGTGGPGDPAPKNDKDKTEGLLSGPLGEIVGALTGLGPAPN